jgi:hypothetical protein
MKKSWVFSRNVLLGFFLGLLNPGVMAAGSDMSDWLSTSIDFSGQVLSFRHPGGFSKEFPDRKAVSKINIHDPVIYGSGRPVAVFEKHWDYKGFFWQGVFGTLSMNVLLYRKPSSFDGSVLDLHNLERLISSLLESEYRDRNQGLRETGQHRFIVKLPDEYRKAGPARDWLYYHKGGHADSDIYAKPLSDSHYLQVAFHFTDNSRNYKTDWRQEAQALTERIMQTMTWEGRPAH